MTDARPKVTGELSRDLGLFHITMMGLGMMIGAGVFVGIGFGAGTVGPGGLLVVMALNGLVAFFSAMSFAELSSAIPRAGGAYNFARIGFGRGISFISGWMEWLASSAAGGFYAIVFATATINFINAVFGTPAEPAFSAATARVAIRVLAVAAAGIFIFINYRGSSETGKIGALFTVGQMLFVAAIGVVGLIVLVTNPERLENFRPFMPGDGWLRMLGVMAIIYVAFEGFEVIAQAGDETIDPKRNIPKAMLYSVLIVTITYVAVAMASIVAIPASVAAEAGSTYRWFAGFVKDKQVMQGFTQAVGHLMPAGLGPYLVLLVVVFSATSAMNATIYSATRVSYALGRDGMLPKLFAHISPRRRTPSGALAATAVIVIVVSLLLTEIHASAMASVMFLLLFFLVNLCVIRIRRNMGDELEYGFLMPLFPLLPILAIILQALLCGFVFEESPVALVIAAGWVAAGTVIYLLYSRSHAPAAEHEIQVLHEEHREPEAATVAGEYRVMVSVANPDNALQLVQTSYKLCQARQASVELLHMVPVPDQVPLSDAGRYMFAGKEAILETMLYLAPMFPISTTLRYCRSISRGIVSAIREKHIDMLIMGWHGRRRRRAFNLGSTVDPIIERSPCDVVVLKDCGGNRSFKRVLVPMAGGPNGALALEIACILADQDAEVVPLTIANPKRPFDIDKFVDAQAERLGIDRSRVRPRTVTASGVVSAILTEAADYDLVVIGATREPLLRHLRRASVPETIAQRCPKPFVMVKASTGIRSWIQRWV